MVGEFMKKGLGFGKRIDLVGCDLKVKLLSFIYVLFIGSYKFLKLGLDFLFFYVSKWLRVSVLLLRVDILEVRYISIVVIKFILN